MSIQSKLSDKTIARKRKMFDLYIKRRGKESNVVQLKIEKDMYGDSQAITIIGKGSITAIIDYPKKLPLTRSRKDTDQAKIDSNTDVFFYEILPIEIITKWADNVERGDLLIDIIFDENKSPLPIILEVTNVLGAFDQQSLIWKQSLAALYNGEINSAVQAEIDTIVSSINT